MKTETQHFKDPFDKDSNAAEFLTQMRDVEKSQAAVRTRQKNIDTEERNVSVNTNTIAPYHLLFVPKYIDKLGLSNL